MNIPLSEFNAFQRGGFKNLDNPWKYACPQAPFDQEFVLQFNVAVGGTQGYFGEGLGNKPWSNNSPNAAKEFWDGRAQWLSTWDLVGEESAMAIDSVKVYKMCEGPQSSGGAGGSPDIDVAVEPIPAPDEPIPTPVEMGDNWLVSSTPPSD
jgi:hypothetical protein